MPGRKKETKASAKVAKAKGKATGKAKPKAKAKAKGKAKPKAKSAKSETPSSSVIAVGSKERPVAGGSESAVGLGDKFGDRCLKPPCATTRLASPEFADVFRGSVWYYDGRSGLGVGVTLGPRY
jgi:hypothetical protein